MIFPVLLFFLTVSYIAAADAEHQGPEVLEVRKRYIVFSLDPGMDLRIGDELEIFSGSSGFGESFLDAAGNSAERKASGRVRITEIYPQAGIARIIYGKAEPKDVLVLSPGLGVDVQSYFGGVMGFSGSLAAVPGLRITGTRGFSGLYPVVGIEFPFFATSVQGVPVFPYLGMQLVWDIGPFQIIPSGILGIGMYLPADAGSFLPADYVGGAGEIGISYLVSDSWRILSGLGYGSWIGRSGLEEDDRYGYNGITLRWGLVWKL